MNSNTHRESGQGISSICLTTTDTDEDNDSTIAIAPSSPRAMESLEQIAPIEQGISLGSSNILVMPQAPPLPLLCGNASNQGSFRSLPAPPERASASNADALLFPLPLPSPVFFSRFTSRQGNDDPQIRPLPQARFPPPTGPPPRAEALSSSPLPRETSPSQPLPSRPINHPNPLGSNPPQRPAALMEQNPQFSLVPLSAPAIRAQEALRSGNVIRTGMQLRPEDLRQPRQFPSPQRQPDHHVPQGGQQYHWNFPGREVVPPALNDRPIDGQLMTGEFLCIRVGGKTFRLPMHLLSQYPFWSALTVFEPPSQGWSIPDVDSEIFTILIECVYTTFGLHGTESGLNLVKLCYAINLAKNWGMIQDRRKLRDTAYRYIVRRILHCNPNLPEDYHDLDYSHHVYRSEELYRTWELSQKHTSIQKMVTPHDLIALYGSVIPQELWPTLTACFKHEFTLLLNISASARRNSAGVAAEVDYRRWWLHYYRLAGFRDASWLSLDAQNRLFEPLNPDEAKSPQERAEFEAARARGSALVNAFEAHQSQEQQPVTLVTLVTPATPDAPSVEELDAAFENAPSSEHRHETRRVHFAQFSQVIRFPRQFDQIQTTAHDAPLDSGEEETFHGEAAPTA